jgi:hypothetical protein
MKKYTFANGTIVIGKLSADERRLEEKKNGKCVKIEPVPKTGYLW